MVSEVLKQNDYIQGVSCNGIFGLPMAQILCKKYAALVLAVEFESEEKAKLSLLEKKIAIFVYSDIPKNRKISLNSI